MRTREIVTFGTTDGLIATVGIILGTAATSRVAVLHACGGLLVGEGFGMAMAELAGESDTGLRQAMWIALSVSVPIILMGVPWLILGNTWATIASVVVGLLIGGWVAARKGGGVKKWAVTYGLLLGTGLISGASGLI